MENRKSDRIPVHLKGHLDWGDSMIPVTLLNLSVGGACLAVDSAHWAKLESDSNLQGLIHFAEEMVPFEGEIRWSLSNDRETLAGIAFYSNQASLIAKTLELLIQIPLEQGTAFRY